MKTTTALMIAVGLASPAAFAQSGAVTGSQQQHMNSPSGTDMPGPAAQDDMHSGMRREMRQGMQDSSGASGDRSRSQAGQAGVYQEQGAEQGAEQGNEPGEHWSSGDSGGSRYKSGPQFNNQPQVFYGPQEKTQNDVAYLCGGVGRDEVSYMKQQAKKYDLMLTFATRSGAYLADVDVNIKDARGNPVLQANCDAPMLLVDLPRSGTYRIRAETSGYSLNRTARVTASHNRSQRVARVAMVWPQKVASASSTAEISSGGSGGRSNGAASGRERDYSGDDYRDNGNQRSRMYPDNSSGTSR